MEDDQPTFSTLLRQWRVRRRMTQEDLAHAAESSTRHLSCLERGRAQPSRAMVARLADVLSLPLREQNNMLVAAGFAPMFRERPLQDLPAVRAALERVLHAHSPYPAFAVDRHWNVVLSNAALPQLYEGCAEALMRPPVNAVRLILHPDGLGPSVVNYPSWRAHTVAVLRVQLERSPDPQVESLLAEVVAYPTSWKARPLGEARVSDAFATPLQIRTRFGELSFLNTNTVFGTPADVTLSELSLEMLFPADQETAAAVLRMSSEQAAVGSMPLRVGSTL